MSGSSSPEFQGNYAPIDFETSLSDLPIAGELPRGLDGTLFRNGPNPQFAPPDPQQHHWFMGDGMIHAFMLRDGKASYRNRWVRTDKWQAEHAANRSLAGGFGGASGQDVPFAATGVANTNIVWHAGRLLALEEAHLPFELDPATLATRGVQNLDGALEGPFTAHPKIDPVTGELVFFGYSTTGPLSSGMTSGTIGRDGRVKRFERFEAPYCSMVHDFAMTQHHVLFPVLPLSGSMQRAMAGKMPYAWEPELGGHIGVMQRDRGVASLRWFRADNCFVFHVLNAWEDGNSLMADVMQYGEPPLFPRADGGVPNPAATRAKLVCWTLDLQAGTDSFKQTEIDDMSGEFPRLDERRTGLVNRFGTFVGKRRGEGGLDTIVWLDLIAGRRAAFTLPDGDGVSEAVFVPRHAGAPEGDGWLLSVAWRNAMRCSELLVLDTDAIDRGPVATVRLPHRVPFGFHGNWMSAA